MVVKVSRELFSRYPSITIQITDKSDLIEIIENQCQDPGQEETRCLGYIKISQVSKKYKIPTKVRTVVKVDEFFHEFSVLNNEIRTLLESGYSSSNVIPTTLFSSLPADFHVNEIMPGKPSARPSKPKRGPATFSLEKN